MTQELTFNLQLTLNEVNAVLAAIQELPAKIANPLAEKIRQQAEPQVPRQEATESAE